MFTVSLTPDQLVKYFPPFEIWVINNNILKQYKVKNSSIFNPAYKAGTVLEEVLASYHNIQNHLPLEARHQVPLKSKNLYEHLIITGIEPPATEKLRLRRNQILCLKLHQIWLYTYGTMRYLKFAESDMEKWNPPIHLQTTKQVIECFDAVQELLPRSKKYLVGKL